MKPRPLTNEDKNWIKYSVITIGTYCTVFMAVIIYFDLAEKLSGFPAVGLGLMNYFVFGTIVAVLHAATHPRRI